MSSYPTSYPPPEPLPWGPFTAGDLIRRTLAIYRENAATAIAVSAIATAIALVPQVVYTAFKVVFFAPATQPSLAHALLMLPITFAFLGVVFFATAVSYALAGGGLFSLAMANRRGERPTVTEVLQSARARAGDALGATLLVWLRLFGWAMLAVFTLIVIAVVIAIVVGVGAGAAGAGGSGSGHAAAAAVGIGFVFGVAFVVAIMLFLLWIGSRYFVTLGALYAEGIAPSASVRRSIALSRRNKGRIFGLLFFILVIGIFVEMVFAAPVVVYFMHSAAHGLTDPAFLQARKTVLIMNGAALVFSAFFNALFYFPVLGIGMALCYFDLRVRAEAAPVPPPLDPLTAHSSVPVPPASPSPVAAPVTATTPAAWPEAPASSAPPGSFGPYLSARYDAPRAFRSDPGRTKQADSDKPEESADEPPPSPS